MAIDRLIELKIGMKLKFNITQEYISRIKSLDINDVPQGYQLFYISLNKGVIIFEDDQNCSLEWAYSYGVLIEDDTKETIFKSRLELITND